MYDTTKLTSYLTQLKQVKSLKNFNFTSIDRTYAYGTKTLTYSYTMLNDTPVHWCIDIPVIVIKSNFKRPNVYPSPRLERFYHAMKLINMHRSVENYVFPINAPDTFVNATSILTLINIKNLKTYSITYSAWAKYSHSMIADVNKKTAIKPFNEIWILLQQKFKDKIRQTAETQQSYTGVSRPIKFELFYKNKWIQKETTVRLLLTKLKYK